MLLTPDGRVDPALVQLAIRHGIQVDEGMSAKQLSEAMQEKWLRKTEHQYQIPPGPASAEDLALLRRLGLVDEIMAPMDVSYYEGAFLLGATRPAVVKRLAHLLKQRIKTNRVYMLGGARKLDPVKESPMVLCTPTEMPFNKDWQAPAVMPTTEAEMMFMVFEQSKLRCNWPFFFVNTPLQPKQDGGVRDPNTVDTVKQMLKFKPSPGTYLVVSHQPFVARQTLNVKAAIPAEFGIQLVGIGYGATESTPLKTFLDEIARLLFERLC